MFFFINHHFFNLYYFYFFFELLKTCVKFVTFIALLFVKLTKLWTWTEQKVEIQEEISSKIMTLKNEMVCSFSVCFHTSAVRDLHEKWKFVCKYVERLMRLQYIDHFWKQTLGFFRKNGNWFLSDCTWKIMLILCAFVSYVCNCKYKYCNVWHLLQNCIDLCV